MSDLPYRLTVRCADCDGTLDGCRNCDGTGDVEVVEEAADA